MSIAEKLITIAENIPKVYNAGQLSVMEASEALKGNVSGNPISIKDVSPIEHNVGVKLSSDTITDFSGTKVSVGGANLLNMDRTAGTFTSGTANTEKREFEFDKFYVGYNRANYYAPIYTTATLQDGVFTITGTGYYGVGIPFEVKPNTQYVFSGEVTNNPYCTFTYYDKDGNYLSAVGGIATGVTTPSNATVAVLCIAPTNDRTVTATNLQIEYGTSATEYEEYIEPTEYTANANGVVAGVKSRYPSMSFSTDTEGVSISVDYYRDIDKIFAALTTAIALSGGE
jgi:hypothetical protein